MAEHDPRFREGESWQDLETNDRDAVKGRPSFKPGRTAYDIKALHEKWPGLSDRILKQIPLLDIGTSLQERAQYFDLMHPERGEFKGRSDWAVEPTSYLVAKKQVDPEFWNALIDIEDNYLLGRFALEVQPERTLL